MSEFKCLSVDCILGIPVCTKYNFYGVTHTITTGPFIRPLNPKEITLRRDKGFIEHIEIRHLNSKMLTARPSTGKEMDRNPARTRDRNPIHFH